VTISDTITWAKPEDVGMSRERVGRIADVFAAEVEQGRLPGAVSLVSRRGKIVHFKAVGRRDPAGSAAMERNSLFRIYSMTKPVVSAAFMTLVEDGLLTLENWVSDILPELADLTVGRVVDGRLEREPAARPITFHDLLRHTAGFTYDWMGDGPLEAAYRQAGLGGRDLSNADVVARLAQLPLKSQPGAAWDYGLSTDVLGRAMEVVTGRTLGAFLRERVSEPLGMPDTGFSVSATEHGRIAEPFPADPDTGAPVALADLHAPSPAESGGTGLVSTASDYARFLHALANGGTLDGERLLGPATIRFMATDHVGPALAEASGFLPAGYGFGLGFAVRRETGFAPFPGGTGDVFWQGLGGTSFWIDPAHELYAVLMIQAPGRLEYYRTLFRQLVYAALDEV
jgi:CubicO group peptidase (beta-lactamase class C family)